MGLKRGEFITHRVLEGAPVSAESGPPTATRGFLQTSGYESAFYGVRLAGGTAPTATLTVYAKDGTEWFKIGTTSALANGETENFECFHLTTFALVTAVTGNPTRVEVKAAPGALVGG